MGKSAFKCLSANLRSPKSWNFKNVEVSRTLLLNYSSLTSVKRNSLPSQQRYLFQIFNLALAQINPGAIKRSAHIVAS